MDRKLTETSRYLLQKKCTILGRALRELARQVLQYPRGNVCNVCLAQPRCMLTGFLQHCVMLTARQHESLCEEVHHPRQVSPIPP